MSLSFKDGLDLKKLKAVWCSDYKGLWFWCKKFLVQLVVEPKLGLHSLLTPLLHMTCGAGAANNSQSVPIGYKHLHDQVSSQTRFFFWGGGCRIPGSGPFRPNPPHKTYPFLAHFVAKSGPFGRFLGCTPPPLATGLCMTACLPPWTSWENIV